MKKFENKVLVVGYYQGDSRCFEFANIEAYVSKDSFETTFIKEVEEKDVPYLSKFYHVQWVRVY